MPYILGKSKIQSDEGQYVKRLFYAGNKGWFNTFSVNDTMGKARSTPRPRLRWSLTSDRLWVKAATYLESQTSGRLRGAWVNV